MRSKKRLVSVTLVLVMLFSISVNALAVNVGGNDVAGQGLYIMDFETGTELFSHNSNTLMVPASLTKLMSLYLVYEAIHSGQLSRTSSVPVSTNTYNLSRDPEFYSNITLTYDQPYYAGELIDLIIVNSSNIGVVMLAEKISKTETAFVARMNQKAKEMGLDAIFYDSVGLSDNNRISPRSMAILTQKLLTDFPEILQISSKSSVTFRGATYMATNYLLTTQYYAGVDGLKTGTTTAAGFCFCGTVKRDGVRLITVVMKSSSNTQRFTDTQHLMNYGFSIRNQIVNKAKNFVEPFTDVLKNEWYADSISYIYKEGLMTGTSGTTFEPGLVLSRAMVATVLYRLAGEPNTASASKFTDVASGQWYTNAINWAYSSGIVTGYSDTVFGVSDNITREQLSTMLYRYSNYLGRDLTIHSDLSRFTDRSSISEWAILAVNWSVGTGLITGTSTTSLSPANTATRAECATILYRFLHASA